MHATQLRALAHESTMDTRSSTAVLHARLTCANLPLSALSDASYGVYAERLVSTRSMRTEPLVGVITSATFTKRIDVGDPVSGPTPPRLLHTR